jgi:hypothetical protein
MKSLKKLFFCKKLCKITHHWHLRGGKKLLKYFVNFFFIQRFHWPLMTLYYFIIRMLHSDWPTVKNMQIISKLNYELI